MSRDRELLQRLIKRLFYREPDWRAWDGESDEIPDRLSLAHNECFDLTDYPELHAELDLYCREHNLHDGHYQNGPETIGGSG